MEEPMMVQRAEFLLWQSRIDLPVREPFSHNLAVQVISRRELGQFLNLLERLGIVSDRLDAVRRALPELDRERAAALETLGPTRVRQALLDELRFKVSDYQQRLDEMVAYLAKFSPQDYEEFTLEEGADNETTLYRRTEIENLLAELGDSVETREARARLAPADALLRARGADLYGPFIRSGLMESMRTAIPEPPERWWYYLDQLGADATTGRGEEP